MERWELDVYAPPLTWIARQQPRDDDQGPASASRRLKLESVIERPTVKSTIGDKFRRKDRREESFVLQI